MSSTPLEVRLGVRTTEGGEPVLWRSHSDAVNGAFLERELAGARFHSALKTDLFDEAVSGGVVPYLQGRADRVTGIDVVPEIVDAARSRCDGLIARAGDVRWLDFEDANFDLVVSLSTLDHLESVAEIEQAVEELARVLAPGGTLVLTLDNPVNPVIAVRQVLPTPRLRAAGLVAYPLGPTVGPRRLERMACRTGLTVRTRTALMHAPRVAAVAIARRTDSPSAQQRFRRLSARFEALRSLPTRYLTGHFSAIVAERR